MTNPSFPAKSLAELVALAKKQPGKLNVGTPPPGTGGYLAAELFKSVAGVDVTIVPFKGTAQLTNDLVGNHVSIGFNVLAPAMGNLQSGDLRAIAVLGPTRSSLFPDVPTAAESGLPDYEAMLHYGLLAPASTPKEIVERLNRELNRWSIPRSCANASRPMAAIRCRRARRNMPPTSTTKRRSGRF